MLPVQERLAALPGWSVHAELRPKVASSIDFGRVRGLWQGRTYRFVKDGKGFSFDLDAGVVAPSAPPPTREANPVPNSHRKRPARGYQYTETYSEDGRWRAFYDKGDVRVQSTADGSVVSVTSDGDPAKRLRYGTCSWVYGEELGQIEAMGWDKAGEKLWLYRYDESEVRDYPMALSQKEVHAELHVEAYPKAGEPNPKAELLIWNRIENKLVELDDRGPEHDGGFGHYVYGAKWSEDGSRLFFFRQNRLQNHLELCEADPQSGRVHVLVVEENPNGWVEPDFWYQVLARPKDRSLEGAILWITERTGFANLALRLPNGVVRQLSKHPFEVVAVEKVDLERGEVWYRAASGTRPSLRQLHRLDLASGQDERLTDPNLDHRVQISPDGQAFVDVAQRIDLPAVTTLRSRTGEPLAELARGDATKLRELGYPPAESIEFLAADGVTKLYGVLERPPRFDPNKRYPLLVMVYAGPGSEGVSDAFSAPTRETDFGFVVARFAGRGTSGRGRAFKDAVYRKLGQVEIDDQAAGATFVQSLPFVAPNQTAITGTSYGGYASIMCLLRHPETFQSAVASSSVTDWRNYDTIYTERYMSTPELNPDGYQAGSAKTYAKDLRGWLMLFYGTSDDNVHPSNTLQLVGALEAAGKSFEVQVGPDQGHTAMGWKRTLEFFFERMVLAQPTSANQ